LLERLEAANNSKTNTESRENSPGEEK